MSKNMQSAIYAAVNAALVALVIVLKDGKAPIPQDWLWLLPVAVAVLTAISPYIAIGAKPPEE